MLQPVINKAHVSINLKKEVRAISSFQGSFQGERKGSALWAPGEGAGLRIRKQYIKTAILRPTCPPDLRIQRLERRRVCIKVLSSVGVFCILSSPCDSQDRIGAGRLRPEPGNRQAIVDSTRTRYREHCNIAVPNVSMRCA